MLEDPWRCPADSWRLTVKAQDPVRAANVHNKYIQIVMKFKIM